ncbi:MAG: hypothetical protein IK061_02835 [Desulfovibrio sp.]|nr:hypothetical protein [Desulfovibrio sp.]
MKDYTREAVARQLGAMRCRRYEFMFRREATGQVEWTRPLTAAGAMEKIPLMKSRNAAGWHIYVRPDPAENRAIVLVDDVKAAGLEKLKARGYPPACVVETSRGSLQCWICLGPEEMPPEERAIVARMLAEGVHADLNSAAKIHLGRLAGFTNVKPRHLGQGGQDRNGRELHPYVLCRESRGVSCRRIEEVRNWAAQKAAENASGAEQACKDRIIRQNLPDVCRRAVQYAGEWTRHREKSGRRLDRSVRDYGVAARLMKDGYSDGEILKGLQTLYGMDREAGVERSKKLDYFKRTIAIVEKRLFGKDADADAGSAEQAEAPVPDESTKENASLQEPSGNAGAGISGEPE